MIKSSQSEKFAVIFNRAKSWPNSRTMVSSPADSYSRARRPAINQDMVLAVRRVLSSFGTLAGLCLLIPTLDGEWVSSAK